MSTGTELAAWGDVESDFASQLVEFRNAFIKAAQPLADTQKALALELATQKREASATLKRLQRENVEIQKHSRELGLRLTDTIKAAKTQPKHNKDAALLALNGNLEALEHVELLADRGDTFALELLALINDLDTFTLDFTAHQFAACVALEQLEQSTDYAPDFTPQLARNKETFPNAPNTHALARVPVSAKARRRLTKT
jgi:hypothetical protein